MDICLDQTQQSLKKVCLELESWGKGKNSYDGVRYDWKKRGFVKIKLVISSQNDQIKYIKNDGQIIRIDKFIGTYKTQEIMTNFEQIYHLQWQGDYNEDLKKIGEWRAFWKGAQLTDVGGSYKNGKKFGLWKELFKNYWDKAQVYEIGEYTKNYKKGVWKLQYRENIIGGGEYNEHGEKTGIWIDLSDDFQEQISLLFKCDQFSLNNLQGVISKWLKIGLWKIFKETRNENFELIGGGSYNESGQKNGQWEELNSNFNEDDRVYYIGEYLNGLKVGRWNINQRVEKGDEEMAGGCYNEQGLKEGMWLDLSPEFQQDGKIFHQGNYKDGKKIGRWKTIYRNQSIGGGLYDKQELKVGLWTELIDHSWNKNQVMYHGEYIIGKKFGRWDIYFKEERKDRPEWIGGGRYDEHGCKIGKWVDLIDNFNDTNQATYNGEYKNGKKYGVWDLMHLNSVIGGGSYDDQSSKHGKWIDQSDNLGANTKVILEGSYFHGKRIDKWQGNYKMPWKNDAQIMWGGFYDQDYQKDGQWLDLQENFEDQY